MSFFISASRLGFIVKTPPQPLQNNNKKQRISQYSHGGFLLLLLLVLFFLTIQLIHFSQGTGCRRKSLYGKVIRSYWREESEFLPAFLFIPYSAKEERETVAPQAARSCRRCKNRSFFRLFCSHDTWQKRRRNRSATSTHQYV